MVHVGRYILLLVVMSRGLTLLGQGASIDVSADNEPIESVLINLAATYDFEIAFNQYYFDGQRISIDQHNLGIEEALDVILNGTDVQHKVVGKAILLSKNKRLFGYVRDILSGEKLINSVVYDPSTGRGVYANEYGYYSISIPAESSVVEVSYIGFEKKTFSVTDITGDVPVNIDLSPNMTLREVVINTGREKGVGDFRKSEKNLLLEGIRSHVTNGGEEDIFQYLNQQAGVQSGPDGLGGMHVRGGNSDQNMVIYDGVTIYNPMHTMGLFSIVNTSLLNKGTFSKYNFHPRHGGRLSSTIDLRLRDGNLSKWKMGLDISTLASQAHIEGPINKDKTSILVSGRRTHLDPIIRSLTRARKKLDDSDGDSNHYFYDLNVKVQHIFNAKDRLYLSYYQGRDYLDDNLLIDDKVENETVRFLSQYDLNWGNHFYSLKWNHLFGNNLFSNLTISNSAYVYRSVRLSDFKIENEREKKSTTQSVFYNFTSSVRDVGVDYDFDYFPLDQMHVTFGAGHHIIQYAPGISKELFSHNIVLPTAPDTLFEGRFTLADYYKSHTSFIYADSDWDISKKMKVTGGLRYSIFDAKKYLGQSSTFYLLQGRLSIGWLPVEKMSISMTLDKSTQPLHMLSNADAGFPNDLWLPSIGDIRPKQMTQYTASANYYPSASSRVSISLYQKYLGNLMRYRDLGTLPSLYEPLQRNNWTENVVLGSGTSRGIELEVGHISDDLEMALSYTLSKSERQFDELSNGRSFPYQFDQRHRLAVELRRKWNPRLSTFINWRFNTGSPQTLYKTDFHFSSLEGSFSPPDNQVSEVNEPRLPPYHRLDVGLTLDLSHAKSKTQHLLTIGVQNIYNRKNIISSYLLKDHNQVDHYGLQTVTALPILPSMRYVFRM